MSTNPGPARNTPSRASNRGGMQYTPNPSASSSAIPRPVLESNHVSHSTGGSEVGASMSASRQKQSKRDEVCLFSLLGSPDDLLRSCSHPPFWGAYQLRG